MLLLHGWPGFWYDWRRIIPGLVREADVIAPDFRGFGDSDTPDCPPAEAYTPHLFATDVIALLAPDEAFEAIRTALTAGKSLH